MLVGVILSRMDGWAEEGPCVSSFVAARKLRSLSPARHTTGESLHFKRIVLLEGSLVLDGVALKDQPFELGNKAFGGKQRTEWSRHGRDESRCACELNQFFGRK